MNTRQITMISIMTALTIVGAYITIPIPNLPFTLQTFFALLAGLILPRRDALISQLIYIAMGLIGLPVFVGGGGGIAYVLRPTFGYVLCLPMIAYIASRFKNRNVYLATYIPLVMLLIIGGLWLVVVAQLYLVKSPSSLILSILIIYIPIEIIKGSLAIVIWKRLRNILDT